jgi:hypothetical protein
MQLSKGSRFKHCKIHLLIIYKGAILGARRRNRSRDLRHLFTCWIYCSVLEQENVTIPTTRPPYRQFEGGQVATVGRGAAASPPANPNCHPCFHGSLPFMEPLGDALCLRRSGVRSGIAHHLHFKRRGNSLGDTWAKGVFPFRGHR